MDELFQSEKKIEYNPSAPLADRVRPAKLEDVVGQEHILGENAPLRALIDNKEINSIILWGPPGSGKTTLAFLIANYVDSDFVRISAVEAGVKDVRAIIDKAKMNIKIGKKSIVFIDEIHRFNKNQQDALLHAVEKGVITLIGATTENPSFEVNSALLSRCQVYRLKELSDEQIKIVIERAITSDPILIKRGVEIKDWDFLLKISGGDARAALNAIDISCKVAPRNKPVIIDAPLLERCLQQKNARYDKDGEAHYDTISAFIKSLRGSDPDAAMYWMAKMINAGEDAKFIARRLVIFASEDIGNADPFALSVAISVFKAVELIGMPEARINLAQGVTYLACCPKSNASYVAVNQALKDVESGYPISVPLHLRNAPTKLMKSEGYGKDYIYPHDRVGHFVKENYFPVGMKPKSYYKPGEFGKEKNFRDRLNLLWKERYGGEE